MASVKSVEFTPNLMVVADFCKACGIAKKMYAKQIESGEIKVVNLDEAIDEKNGIPGLVDCLYASDTIGVPVLAKIEDGKVVACRIGVGQSRITEPSKS